jgi:hypothetical protein
VAGDRDEISAVSKLSKLLAPGPGGNGQSKPPDATFTSYVRDAESSGPSHGGRPAGRSSGSDT